MPTVTTRTEVLDYRAAEPGRMGVIVAEWKDAGQV